MAFKYDVVTLIELIEMRPCLWDKTTEEFKDKIKKQNAWFEIYKFLEINYDNLTSKEKKEVGDKITNKWTNIKDAYLKSLKTNSGQGTKKTYLYASYLSFLLKCYKKEATVDSINSPQNVDDSSYQDYINRDDTITTQDLEEIDFDITTSNRNLENIEIQILEELKNKQRESQTKKPDEELFFHSFIPYEKDMTEEEKLELHLDILTSIKKIKQNRCQIQSDMIQSPVQCSSSHFFINNNRDNQPSQSEVILKSQRNSDLNQQSTNSNIIIHGVKILRPPAADNSSNSYQKLFNDFCQGES